MRPALAGRRAWLAVVPTVACLAATFVFASGAWVPILGGIQLVCLGFAIAIAGWLAWHERRLAGAAQRAGEALGAAQAESDALAAEVRRLQGEAEGLAAAREIGLIVNADNEFADVCAKVLRIVADLLRAEEVTLFLRDAETGALKPAARHRDGTCVTGTALDAATVDRTQVAEALAANRLLRLADGARLALTLPLAVDGRVVGVLRAALDLEHARPEERAAECERALSGIERHLALAIKAPTLYDRAVRDGLTGLYSRRHLDHQLSESMQIAERTSRPVSVMLADVDHFKKVNDTFGHQAGDQVLREVAAVLRQSIRAYDTAYRYGGEELVVLMPDTTLDEAVKSAERIRKAIEKRVIKSPEDGKRIAITSSFGVAEWRPGMRAPAALLEAADQALYRAKQGGRNRVEATEPAAPVARRR